MARPALDKKTGKTQQQVGKKRGRPPKAKPLEVAKTKPQKKESIRAILRRTNKDKKEAKKTKLAPQKQGAPKHDTKKDQTAAGEAATQEPVLSQGAAPAQPKPTSSVASYISESWTYLSELVRGKRFGRRQ